MKNLLLILIGTTYIILKSGEPVPVYLESPPLGKGIRLTQAQKNRAAAADILRAPEMSADLRRYLEQQKKEREAEANRTDGTNVSKENDNG